MKALFLSAFLFIALLSSIGVAWAIDVSGTLWQANVNTINVGFDRTNFGVPTSISGSKMIDDAFVASDYQNAVIHKGTSLVPSMPPNNRIVMEGAVVDDGGAFTEFTTEIQDATQSDVALLPAVPVTGDAIYFGSDNPSRILSLEIGQEGDGDWALDWEYWNGTTFTDLSGIEDKTDAFRNPGLNTVTFDTPTDWATTTVTGSAVSSYWVRATASVTGSGTQQAIADQGWYENGRHWSWVESLDQNEEEQYLLSFGGPDLVARHSVFPGVAGVVTPDDATMELTDDFGLHFEGSVSFAVTGSGTQCLVCKGNALRLTVTDTDEITLSVSGSGVTTLTVDTIPEATQGVSGSGHTIDVLSDGTDVELIVQGVGSQKGTAQDISDTADSWEFATNNAATFFDQIFMLPDDASLGQIDIFDTVSEWDTGTTLTNTRTTIGQPVATLDETYFIDVYDDPDTDSCDDGFWREGNSDFIACDTPGSEAGVLIFGFNATAGRDEHNVFMRFDDVNIASADRDDITSALIRVRAVSTDACTTASVRIQAVAADDPVAPTTFAAAEALTLTTAFVDWTPPAFTTNVSYDLPDLSSVLNEVLSRAGWNSGNAILFVISELASTGNCTHGIAPVEHERTPPRLVVTRSTDPADPTAPTNDFLELNAPGTPGSTTGPMVDWDGDANCVSGLIAATNIGLFEQRVGASTVDCFQDLPASAGQVWSISAYGNGVTTKIRWLDASKVQIGADVLGNLASNVWSRWAFSELNGATAPANTAFIRVVATGSAQLDGVMACVCSTAPTYPSALNLILNHSFENIYESTGTWVSPAIALTVDDVASTSINWDTFGYSQATTSTVLVESRLDGGAWFAQTNGSSIAGISPGDNVNGSILELRVTLTGDKEFSPGISLLSAFVGQDPGLADTNVFYELRSTPGVLLTDLSPNGNDGVMSYPALDGSIAALLGPIESRRGALSQGSAVGIADFASPITGSQVASLYTDETGTGFFLFEIFNSATTASNIPIQVIWVALILACGVVVGALVLRSTSSLGFAVVAMGGCAVLAAVVGDDGLIAFWIIFIYAVIAGALLLLRPRMPL